MNTSTAHFNQAMVPTFYKGATHDQIKWSINYLIGLLEVPETILSNTEAESKAEYATRPAWWNRPISKEILALMPKHRAEMADNYKDELSNRTGIIALTGEANVIVTRNAKDFANSTIKVQSPNEFLNEYFQ